MKYFFILPFVLEFLFPLEVSGLAEVLVSYKREKDITISCETLKNEFDIKECEFHSPSGVIINKDGDTKYPFVQFEEQGLENISKCSVSIIGKRSENDYGKWACILKDEGKSTNASVDVERIIPKIEQGKLSKRSLYFKRGGELKVICEENTNLDYCRIQSPNGLDFLMTKGESSSGFQTYWLRSRNCEITISNASDENNGEWICEYRKQGNFTQKKKLFSVKVVENNLVSEVRAVKENKAIEMRCRKVGKDFGYLHCDWTRPDGGSVTEHELAAQYYSDIDDFSCWIHFKYLYEEQIGNWTCRLRGLESSPGSYGSILETFDDTLNVNLHDSYEMISSVVQVRNAPTAIVTANYNYYDDFIDISCDVETDEQHTRCYFTRFDELHDAGIGYPYFNGDNCRHSIHKPKHSHFGNWTCYIEFPGMLIKSTVNVQRNLTEMERDLERNLLASSANKPIKAKLNKGFKVGCQIQIWLAYCKIKSPSGVLYEVELEKEFPPINGTSRGLENGDCSVFIKSANHENIGSWTCTLGLQENLEFNSTIQVELSEPHLIPDENVNADLNNAYKEKTLTCKASSDFGEGIDSCRWTHPDGTEIMAENLEKFKIEKSHKTCSVRLKNFNEKDFGQWKCHAFMNDNLDKEHHAIVEFGKRQVGFWDFSDTFIAGSIILFIILSIVFGYLCYIHFCGKE